MMRGRKSEAGFTLLELVVGMAIIAIIMVAQVAPFQQTIESRDHAAETARTVSAARLTLLRLSEELSGTTATDDPRSAFLLSEQSLGRSSSELRFATTGAQRVQAGPRDPVEVVRYYLERTPNQTGSFRLIKEQLPSMAAQGVEPTSMVVLEDVSSFGVEVLRNGRWSTQWESGPGQVPRAVRLQLEIENGSGSPIAYRTTVTLPMGDRS